MDELILICKNKWARTARRILKKKHNKGAGPTNIKYILNTTNIKT